MKRIISILMVLMMVFCLSACKKKADISSGADTSSTASRVDANKNEIASTDDDTAVTSSTPTTPHDAVTEGTVIDAITYSKDVTPAKDVDAKDFENQKHVIAVPKISKESANAEAFNKKIYDESAKIYETLQKDKEKKDIYNVGYEYKEYKDIVGIMVMNNVSSQDGGAKFEYKTYYYDLKKDKQLDYQEYLKALGIKESKIKAAAEATKEFAEMLNMSADKEKVYVKESLLDANGSIIFINNPNEKGAWWRIDIASLL